MTHRQPASTGQQGRLQCSDSSAWPSLQGAWDARRREGAPELTESLANFSINAGALALFSWLFSRDFRAAERDRRVVDREEDLGRLLVQP